LIKVHQNIEKDSATDHQIVCRKSVNITPKPLLADLFFRIFDRYQTPHQIVPTKFVVQVGGFFEISNSGGLEL
jgi:hypothetical protein